MTSRKKSLAPLGDGFEIVESSSNGRRLSRYLDVRFKTLKEAELERADLLRHFAATNAWRKKLWIRHPNGCLSNPDFPEETLAFSPDKL